MTMFYESVDDAEASLRMQLVLFEFGICKKFNDRADIKNIIVPGHMSLWDRCLHF